MLSKKVSFYNNVLDLTGIQKPLGEILEDIKTGTWKNIIETLRNIEQDKERKEFKKTIPCFTASGIFTPPRNGNTLQQHSGIMVVDIDSKDNPGLMGECNESRQHIIDSGIACFIFASAGGAGLAIGINIKENTNRESYEYFIDYFKEKYDLIVDRGCKDVNRLRFISFDPFVHIDESAPVFSIPKQSLIPHANFESIPTVDYSHKVIKAIIESGKLIGDDSHDMWVRIAFALVSEFGEEGRQYFHALSMPSAKYDTDACDKKYDNCLRTSKGDVTFGTIVVLARYAGIDTRMHVRGDVQNDFALSTVESVYIEKSECVSTNVPVVNSINNNIYNNYNRARVSTPYSTGDENIQTVTSRVESVTHSEIYPNSVTSRDKPKFVDILNTWILSTNGKIFSTKDIYLEFNLQDHTSKAGVRKILQRFKDDRFIEISGNKQGYYRLVDVNCQRIDWKNADLTEVPISYPLGLEKKVVTLRKTIIVIAGVSDAGKSAFMLHLAALNAGKGIPIKYFSSEMGDAEIKFRIKSMGIPFDLWDDVDFRDREDNFADVIDPDAINIVDYMEVYENFYSIGQKIKDIYGKLRKGIAVIAIQKDANKKEGAGGMFSKHKSRLYLTIDYGVLEIAKAKNKRYMESNIRGSKIDFNINKGMMNPTSDWYM